MSSRFRCPSCSTVFQLAQLPANGLVRCPSCRATVRVGPAAGTATGAPAVSTPGPTFDFSAVAAPVQPFPLHHQLRYEPVEQRSGSGAPRPDVGHRGGWSKGLFIGLAVAVGSCALLGVLAVAAVFVAATMPVPKTAISHAGYTADAPGRIAPQRPGARGSVQSVIHPKTGSEFAVLSISDIRGVETFTPERYVEGMAQQGQLSDRQPVQRAGLSGIHYQLRDSAAAPDHVGEVFMTGDHLLVLIYSAAAHKDQIPKSDADLDPDRVRELDDPDAFFASLRKAQ